MPPGQRFPLPSCGEEGPFGRGSLGAAPRAGQALRCTERLPRGLPRPLGCPPWVVGAGGAWGQVCHRHPHFKSTLKNAESQGAVICPVDGIGITKKVINELQSAEIWGLGKETGQQETQLGFEEEQSEPGVQALMA